MGADRPCERLCLIALCRRTESNGSKARRFHIGAIQNRGLRGSHARARACKFSSRVQPRAKEAGYQGEVGLNPAQPMPPSLEQAFAKIGGLNLSLARSSEYLKF